MSAAEPEQDQEVIVQKRIFQDGRVCRRRT